MCWFCKDSLESGKAKCEGCISRRHPSHSFATESSKMQSRTKAVLSFVLPSSHRYRLDQNVSTPCCRKFLTVKQLKSGCLGSHLISGPCRLPQLSAKMEASCQCGAVSFTTPAARPTHFWICHCTDCQKQSGSAYAASAMFPYFPPPTSSSNDSLGKWTRKCDSGNSLECYFCNKCGTRLIHQTFTPDGQKKETTTVRAGTLDDRVELPWTTAPHIWTKSALVGIPKGVMTYPEEPDDDSVAEIQQKQKPQFEKAL